MRAGAGGDIGAGPVCHPLGGQLGPELLLPPLHLVPTRLATASRTRSPARAGHLAGRAAHLDHQGVGLEPGRGLVDGPTYPALGPQ